MLQAYKYENTHITLKIKSRNPICLLEIDGYYIQLYTIIFYELRNLTNDFEFFNSSKDTNK